MNSSGWLELLSGEVRIPLRRGRLFDREPRSRSRQRCGTLDRRRQTCAMLSRPGGGYPSVSKGSVAWLTSLKGEADLCELRPRQGSSKSRPIFVRAGDDYLILAIALDHDSDMNTAVQNAKDRLKEREG